MLGESLDTHYHRWDSINPITGCGKGKNKNVTKLQNTVVDINIKVSLTILDKEYSP